MTATITKTLTIEDSAEDELIIEALPRDEDEEVVASVRVNSGTRVLLTKADADAIYDFLSELPS